MPIRWSALKVKEAAEMIEVYIKQAVEPLEQARLVAQEARRIPNLPQYIDQFFSRLIGEIDRAIGGSLHAEPSGQGQWETEGRMYAAVDDIRKSLPDQAVESELVSAQYGSTQRLI